MLYRYEEKVTNISSFQPGKWNIVVDRIRECETVEVAASVLPASSFRKLIAQMLSQHNWVFKLCAVHSMIFT